MNERASKTNHEQHEEQKENLPTTKQPKLTRSINPTLKKSFSRPTTMSTKQTTSSLLPKQKRNPWPNNWTTNWPNGRKPPIPHNIIPTRQHLRRTIITTSKNLEWASTIKHWTWTLERPSNNTKPQVKLHGWAKNTTKKELLQAAPQQTERLDEGSNDK